MSLAKTNGFLEPQTRDEKVCNVWLGRWEWSFQLPHGHETPWRGGLWLPRFSEVAAFSQIKEAPKRLFTLLFIKSQISSAKIIFIPTLGPKCVRTVCWNHKEVKLPCKPLTPGSSQEASCELCLELCEALLIPKSWDSKWWNEELKVTQLLRH